MKGEKKLILVINSIWLKSSNHEQLINNNLGNRVNSSDPEYKSLKYFKIDYFKQVFYTICNTLFRIYTMNG